jgi:phage baseplate assembly protein W
MPDHTISREEMWQRREQELLAELEQLGEALQAIVDTPRGRDWDMRAVAAQALRERALRGKN